MWMRGFSLEHEILVEADPDGKKGILRFRSCEMGAEKEMKGSNLVWYGFQGMERE